MEGGGGKQEALDLTELALKRTMESVEGKDYEAAVRAEAEEDERRARAEAQALIDKAFADAMGY
eukprot:3904987-Pyramimonas_sp.AAC.1